MGLRDCRTPFWCKSSAFPREGPTQCEMSSPTPRAKCELTKSELRLVLKEHVGSLSDGLYLMEDVDAVVDAYATFLAECAKRTPRINATLLAEAAVYQFGVKHHAAKKFADAIVLAFGHCLRKGRQATSGAKLRSSVKAVLTAALMNPKIVGIDSSFLGENLAAKPSASSASSAPLGADHAPYTQAQVMALYGQADATTPVSQHDVMSSQEKAEEVFSRQEVHDTIFIAISQATGAASSTDNDPVDTVDDKHRSHQMGEVQGASVT